MARRRLALWLPPTRTFPIASPILDAALQVSAAAVLLEEGIEGSEQHLGHWVGLLDHVIPRSRSACAGSSGPGGVARRHIESPPRIFYNPLRPVDQFDPDLGGPLVVDDTGFLSKRLAVSRGELDYLHPIELLQGRG